MTDYATLKSVGLDAKSLPLSPADDQRNKTFSSRRLLHDGQLVVDLAICPNDFDSMVEDYFDLGVNELAADDKILTVRAGSKITTFGVNDLTGSQARLIWLSMMYPGREFEYASLRSFFDRESRIYKHSSAKAWKQEIRGVFHAELIHRVFPPSQPYRLKIASVNRTYLWIAPHISPRDSKLLQVSRSRN